MNDAWMVRGSERQNLLESLKREVMEKENNEEPGRHVFQYDLAHVLLQFLLNEEMVGCLTESIGNTYFQCNVLPKTSGFARAKEERDVIICELLTWLVTSITSRFHSNLLHREIMDPQTIFRAPSATTQI